MNVGAGFVTGARTLNTNMPMGGGKTARKGFIMERYVIHNLTARQLDMLWFGLYFLRQYVKGFKYREERFGSDAEIEEMMTRVLHGEEEDDDTETTA